MRVLFWSENFWPHIGGIEVLAARLIRALRARGHELLVVTRKDSVDLADEATFEEAPVYRLPLWTTLVERDLEQLAQVTRAVRDLKRGFRPDVVHMNAVRPGAVFHHCTASAYPAPTLVTVHGLGPERFIQSDTLLLATLRQADWITTCSEAVLRAIRRHVPSTEASSCTILNSLDSPMMAPMPLPLASPRLLCLGRLAPEKGFDVAIAAFSRVLERWPDSRLIVAGDGPDRGELEQLAAALGIAGAIDFIGWVALDDVPRLINRSSVVVMPSREEPFGLVALQAAQMGRPVVASQVDGLPEVVADGESGILVPVEDSPALANALVGLLGDPERARRMGAAAERRARQLFDWERCVDAYEALYARLSEARADRSPGEPTRSWIRPGDLLR